MWRFSASQERIDQADGPEDPALVQLELVFSADTGSLAQVAYTIVKAQESQDGEFVFQNATLPDST